MRYYANYNELGVLASIGTGPGGTEIAKEEYDYLLTEIRYKAQLVEDVLHGAKSIDEVQPQWQDEIQRRVAEREEHESADDVDIPVEEALNIILGGGAE